MSLGTGALKVGRGLSTSGQGREVSMATPLAGTTENTLTPKCLEEGGTCTPRKEPWEPPNIPKKTQALHEDKESIRTYLATRGWEPHCSWESLIQNDCLRLLPTFRRQKNVFFFHLAKFKSVILSSVYKRKILKISKSGRVI